MKTTVVALVAFTAGLLIGAPPWATRYLLLGAIVCVAFALLLRRPTTPDR